MRTILQGIVTEATKHELEKAKAERTRLQAAIKSRTTKPYKVATFLPRPKEWVEAIMRNLAETKERNVAQAREQLRDLLGQIRLAPTADGYLEAVLTGDMKGF